MKSPPGAVPQSQQGAAVPPAPPPQFLNGAKDLQQLGTGWSWRKPQYPVGGWRAPGPFPFPCLRPLTWDQLGKPPPSSLLDGSVPSKADCPGQQPRLPSLLLPHVQQASCPGGASLSHPPPQDSWVPGNGMGPPRKERRAGQVSAVKSWMFPRPQT